MSSVSCAFYSLHGKGRRDGANFTYFTSLKKEGLGRLGRMSGALPYQAHFPHIPDRRMVLRTITHQDLISKLGG